jgi:phosphopantothenoylcysteine decarboxylase/phosphopantothenate--cysteine ligase
LSAQLPLEARTVLLVIAGGIAAYKSLELIRRLQDRGARVRCILTKAGAEFVTPLSVAALSGEKVHQDLFSLTDESEMGHIRLARDCDVIVVAPATADLMARMATGQAGDLATTVLLASDKPILIAPSMNVQMWQHPATQRNAATLRGDGVAMIGPAEGDLACGEVGSGRMVEPDKIVARVEAMLAAPEQSLAGRTALVTSGPTREAIDPVRYLGNFSSGKQGHAIASALARRGAKTVLVTGPTAEPDPAGVLVRRVETGREMLEACRAALPADIAVFAAAVADWRPEQPETHKLKKGGQGAAVSLALIENPDVLGTLARSGPQRPALVVGFAAETESDPDRLIERAMQKRANKNCDWVVANDVSPGTGVLGGGRNTVHVVTAAGAESWPTLDKTQVAERLADRIAAAVSSQAKKGAPAA